jgi:aspartate aminotransferase-like enzyme
MINHRGPEFKALIESITGKTKKAFETTKDLYILTASGTGGMEAAVVNTISPGDKVLAITVGIFGNRFVQIAKAYRADLTVLSAEYGRAIDPAEVQRVLDANPSIKAVIVTHNETSTGITNDLANISKIVKGQFGKLLLVDAISSIGSIPCPVDEWDLDIVVGGSQKGWMAPPGLSMISVSDKAWEAYEEATTPKFYFDLMPAKRYLERAQTPWTPAVGIMFALEVALDKLAAEGMDNVHERHAKIAKMCREGVKAIGLQLFADESHASNTVTAVRMPDNVNGAELLGTMRTEYDVVLAGGQAELDGKIFRIGHLGHCSESDIQNVIESLVSTFEKLGVNPAKASLA